MPASSEDSMNPAFIRQNDPVHKALEALGVNRQQFQIFFGDILQGVILCKMVRDDNGEPVDYVVLEVNEAFEKILKIKRTEVIGKKVSYAMPELKKVGWLDKCRKGEAPCQPALFEAYFVSLGRWYQAFVYSPKKDYLVLMFTDVTERKKNQERLLRSEKMYSRLYETTQDGIMARNLLGDMIDCNQAYARMLGYSKEELKHFRTQQLIPEKWHNQREEVIKEVLETGRSIVFEREYKRKDGSVFPASVRTWRLTDENGNVVGVWSIVRDLAEQKRFQKKLEEYAKNLEKLVEERTKQLKDSERMAAIGQTAGMVGHDLRNPLQTIIGETYIAKEDAGALPEGEVKRNLQESIKTIEEQTIYMDKIVSDLQAFVRPIRPEKKSVSLQNLVDYILKEVIIPKNVTVQVQIQEGFPRFDADIHLLRRVLLNLLNNALQAMPNGGELTIKAQVQTKNAKVCISVIDTGVGIPEEIKSKIFTPLFTTKPRGQGFGLAVCRRVIEAHEGVITFTSQEGKGSEFIIELPLKAV